MSPPVRVVVIGAGGRLGSAACSAIEACSDLALAGRYSSRDDWLALVSASRPDVAFDATRAGLGAQHGMACLEAGARIVVATSGVTPEQEVALDRRARELALGGLIVPNFSIGAMLLLRACAEFARHFPACEIVELHHDKKRDAPSGTALETERRIRAVPSRPSSPVPIHSVRLPGLYAHQEVLFSGPGELLTLRHDAFSPQAFQAGIVAAVRYVARASGVRRGIEHAFES